MRQESIFAVDMCGERRVRNFLIPLLFLFFSNGNSKGQEKKQNDNEFLFLLFSVISMLSVVVVQGIERVKNRSNTSKPFYVTIC